MLQKIQHTSYFSPLTQNQLYTTILIPVNQEGENIIPVITMALANRNSYGAI